MTYDKNPYYIIRADRAGVFFAQITDRRGSEVDLVNCRRIHGWSNACSISQIATDGCGAPGGNYRHSVTVPSMTVLGVIEVIPCSDAAAANLLSQPEWRPAMNKERVLYHSPEPPHKVIDGGPSFRKVWIEEVNE